MNTLVVVVVVVVVLYSPNKNRYITDTCKTNNSIKQSSRLTDREITFIRQGPDFQKILRKT